MNFAVKTRFPKSAVLGVLLAVVLSACDASSCSDLSDIPNSFPDVSPRISCTDGSESRREDAEALVALYNATDGLNWENNTNWLTDAPISDWAGVTASDKTVNGRSTGECVVRSLRLSWNQLSGEIPAEMGNLSNLGSLDPSHNQLSGAIPAEMGNLLNPYSLDLSHNQLSGTIPAELGKIPVLFLDGNQLRGIMLRPNGPTDAQYGWDGSTIRVSWDAVDGADYYKVYHHHFIDNRCLLGKEGIPRFCDELAANFTETTYVHSDPDDGENYYWIVACNRGGCSEIDSDNPAQASP